jgi:photosystem II PsbY protein
MDLDFRLVLVLAPILLAGGWAIFNIGQAALKQIQGFLNKEA